MRTKLGKLVDEYIVGHETLKDLNKNIVVFGSARTKPDHPDYLMCVQVSRELSRMGYNIITGGGPGIMEAANRGCQEGKLGKSIGLNLELPFEENENRYQDIRLYHHSFATRKAMFFKNTAAYYVFPGGDGTMDELFEARTLMNCQKIPAAPIVICDTKAGGTSFGDHVYYLLHMLLDMGTISSEGMHSMHFADSVETATWGIKI